MSEIKLLNINEKIEELKGKTKFYENFKEYVDFESSQYVEDINYYIANDFRKIANEDIIEEFKKDTNIINNYFLSFESEKINNSDDILHLINNSVVFDKLNKIKNEYKTNILILVLEELKKEYDIEKIIIEIYNDIEKYCKNIEEYSNIKEIILDCRKIIEDMKYYETEGVIIEENGSVVGINPEENKYFDNLEEARKEAKERWKYTSNFEKTFQNILINEYTCFFSGTIEDMKTLEEIEMRAQEIMVAYSESGDIIEDMCSIEEGIELIKEYEEEDKKMGVYKENVYVLINGNGEKIEF